jgi:isopentenyl diphosphate isomerase/L-lactate dehydrogenase-like FMN-dependent dehydrogenase
VIRKELDTTMVYVGAKTIDELTPDILFGPRRNSATQFVG